MRDRLPGIRLHLLLVRLHPSRFRTRFGPASERLFADWVGRAPPGPERNRRARQAVLQAIGTLIGSWSEEVRLRTGLLGRGVGAALERFVGGAVAAGRTARRHPAQATTVILTVAIAVGANAALFTVARTLLLRPLPYHDAGNLVRAQGGSVVRVDEAGFELREEFVTLPGIEAAAHYIPGGSANLSGDAETTRIRLSQVSADFFAVLGAEMALGRGLLAADLGEPAVVLGHGLWRDTFAGDPEVLGRELEINGRPYTIVGVAPPEVDFPAETAAWLPTPYSADLFGNAFGAGAIARVDAGAQLSEINRRLAARFEAAGRTVSPNGHQVPVPELVELREFLLRDVTTPLFTLLGAALLVLLLGGLNLAGLWASQTADRMDELRLRRALGASRTRIVAELMAENLAVSMVGGLAAILVAGAVTGALASLMPSTLPGISALAADGATALAAILLAVVAGLVFGAVAALSTLGAERGSTRRTRDSVRSRRLQIAFVVGQGALALVLVAGSGLMVRSFQELASAPLGFDPEGTLSFQVRLPESDATTEIARGYAQELERRLAGLPGVASVGMTNLPPLSFELGYAVQLRPPGDEAFEPVMALAAKASDRYFEAAGIPMLSGRAFYGSAGDDPGLVVDTTVAARLFPDGGAAGSVVEVLEVFNGEQVWRETRVRGVAGAVHAHGVRSSAYPAVYYDLKGHPSNTLGVILRVEGNPSRLASDVRATALEVRPTVAPYNVRSLRSIASELLSTDRVLAIVGACFSLVAIGLAAIGLYGLMARTIARRRREYGVRLALGAEARRLVGGTIRGAVGLGLLAIALGLPGALIAARLIRSRLYGVEPFDPLVLVAGCILLLVVVVTAAWLPARRITRVDPREALTG